MTSSHIAIYIHATTGKRSNVIMGLMYMFLVSGVRVISIRKINATNNTNKFLIIICNYSASLIIMPLYANQN